MSEKSQTKSDVKARCLVHTVFDASVTWLMDRKEPPHDKVKETRNTTHLTSTLTVSLDDWKQLKQLTCKAEHSCISSAEETIHVAGKIIMK